MSEINPHSKKIFSIGSKVPLNQIGIKSPIQKNYKESSFTIAHSFLLDGVNEYFTIPVGDLDTSIFGGTNNKYTIYVDLKRVSTGSNQYIFAGLNGANMFLLYFDAVDRITIITNNNTKTLKTSTALTDTTNFHFIKISVDLEDTATNSHIKIDNVTQSLFVNDLTSTTPLATGNYEIGRRNNNSSFLNAYISYLAVINRLTTTTEDKNIYNNGKPKNPNTVFGSSCKMFLNADNSGSTAHFTIADSVNSLNATSVNLEDADKTTETPY